MVNRPLQGLVGKACPGCRLESAQGRLPHFWASGLTARILNFAALAPSSLFLPRIWRGMMWKLRGKTEQSLSDAFRRQNTFSHRQMTATSTLARNPARKTGARPQVRPRMMRSSAWGELGRRGGAPRTCRVVRCCEQLYSWRQAGDGKDAGAVLCMRGQLHRTQAGKQFRPYYSIPGIVDKKSCRQTVVYL